jgi:hypothetical protein
VPVAEAAPLLNTGVVVGLECLDTFAAVAIAQLARIWLPAAAELKLTAGATAAAAAAAAASGDETERGSASPAAKRARLAEQPVFDGMAADQTTTPSVGPARSSGSGAARPAHGSLALAASRTSVPPLALQLLGDCVVPSGSARPYLALAATLLGYSPAAAAAAAVADATAAAAGPARSEEAGSTGRAVALPLWRHRAPSNPNPIAAAAGEGSSAERALVIAADREARVRSLLPRGAVKRCLRCLRGYHDRERCRPPGVAANSFALLCPAHSYRPLPGETEEDAEAHLLKLGLSREGVAALDSARSALGVGNGVGCAVDGMQAMDLDAQAAGVATGDAFGVADDSAGAGAGAAAASSKATSRAAGTAAGQLAAAFPKARAAALPAAARALVAKLAAAGAAHMARVRPRAAARLDDGHFRLPTSLLAALESRPPSWTRIAKNVYLYRVRPARPDVDSDVCTCASTSTSYGADGRRLCDDNCVNRLLRVECRGGGGGAGGGAGAGAGAGGGAAAAASGAGDGADSEAAPRAPLSAAAFSAAAGASSGAAALDDGVSHARANCSLGPSCGNRALQQRAGPPLELVPTPGKGWGVNAGCDVPEGAFLIEYVGEVISEAMQVRRGGAWGYKRDGA